MIHHILSILLLYICTKITKKAKIIKNIRKIQTIDPLNLPLLGRKTKYLRLQIRLQANTNTINIVQKYPEPIPQVGEQTGEQYEQAHSLQ